MSIELERIVRYVILSLSCVPGHATSAFRMPPLSRKIYCQLCYSTQLHAVTFAELYSYGTWANPEVPALFLSSHRLFSLQQAFVGESFHAASVSKTRLIFNLPTITGNMMTLKSSSLLSPLLSEMDSIGPPRP